MTIIPQKLKNEIKKITKNVINEAFSKELCSLNQLLYIKNSPIHVISILKKTMLEIYQKSIPLIDDIFLNSDYRKRNFYKSNTNNRTIITIYGELNYTRNYYVDKDKNNGFYFVDEVFNFDRYVTYDHIVRSILIDKSIDINANNASINYDLNLFDLKSYLDSNATQSISRQTIYNWIHKWNLPKVEYDYIDDDSNHLYVMVDEKWIHEQIRLALLSEEERGKHHYIMSKCFVTFTGAKTKNNRTTLLNKHTFLTTSNNAWKEFMDEIYNIYNYENFKEIYLLSDSGSWILSGSSELKLFKENKVILNTCEFHVKEYINRFTHSKESRKELLNSIYEEKDKKKFTKLADKIIEESKNKKKKEQYKNYILRHWKAILNMKDREVKSSMESHISHCVASQFGSRPKGYSRRRIQKYIKLQEYKLNGINIMDLYLRSYNKDDSYVYNKTEISYSMFERDTSVLPVKSSSDPISYVLNGLAFSI